jgi:hypothetical protein
MLPVKRPLNAPSATIKPMPRLMNIVRIGCISAFAASCIYVASDRPKFVQANYEMDQESIYFVNPDYIRWVQKGNNNCYRLCTKPDGCYNSPHIRDTYVVCPGTKSFSDVEKFVK